MNPISDEQLLFVPLGGAGEIGMNLYLYGYGSNENRRWLMVDLGITFGDDSTPGVDVLMADPSFIAEQRDQLEGLVLTHAHEDHLGAVPHLWKQLRCPIYATPFAASLLRRKLPETGIDKEVEIVEIPLGGRFQVGPFDIELISMNHSIPEPNALAIRTPLGTVLHSGDWKLDPSPVIGSLADEEALRRIGDEGVLALLCDSTNVFEPGTSGSEADLLEGLTEIVADCKNRVAITCFATNVARLRTISKAAVENGRDVVLLGRSLSRIEEIARENGYLEGTPAFLDETDAAVLSKDKVLYLCTGSQGEPRAALARIASDTHARVKLEQGDTVIFSSRIIPGNELSIGRLQNRLAGKGVRIITEKDAAIHVSGHPAREELVRMYQLVRPRIAVPIHGETRHLMEHILLARQCGVAETVLAENGTMVRIAPGKADVAGEVPVGRLALEGGRVVPMNGELVRGRNRAVYNGSAVVTVVLDSLCNVVADPQLTATGLLDAGDDDMKNAISDAVCMAIGEMKKSARKDDDKVREAVRIAVRRKFRNTFGKKPVTNVHLVRL